MDESRSRGGQKGKESKVFNERQSSLLIKGTTKQRKPGFQETVKEKQTQGSNDINLNINRLACNW